MTVPKHVAARRHAVIGLQRSRMICSAYTTTWIATHQMRSYRTAFDLLREINRTFQTHFPLPAVA